MSSMGRDEPNPAEPQPPKRSFTLAEANRSLVLVRRVAADVVEAHGRLLDLQEALEAAEVAGCRQQCEESRLDLIRTAGRLRSFVEELNEIGVELEDWSLGVVDFPSLAGGRSVRLCWQHGQKDVRYWHEANADITGRQPIETLPGGGTYAPERPAEPACTRADRAFPRRAKGTDVFG